MKIEIELTEDEIIYISQSSLERGINTDKEIVKFVLDLYRDHKTEYIDDLAGTAIENLNDLKYYFLPVYNKIQSAIWKQSHENQRTISTDDN